jgi:hypothetical protein
MVRTPAMSASAKKLLLPLVSDKGFSFGNGMFVRQNQSWHECFSVQASRYGSPHFWVGDWPKEQPIEPKMFLK